MSLNSFEGINLIFHTIGPGGGMERYTMDLIHGFLKSGLKVRVIVNKLIWDGSIPEGLDFVVMKGPKLFGSRLRNLWYEKNASMEVNQAWPVISLSHTPYYSDIAITGGTHKRHLMRKKIHFIGLFHWIKMNNERVQFELAPQIISHSFEGANEIAEDYGITKSKIQVLYPPIDSKNFTLQAREKRSLIRQKWGVSDNEFLLIFPSNDHRRKGKDLILKALELSDPRIRLVVASKTPIQHDKVINLGFQTDMASVYAAGDASILASIYEPFGYVGPESILCGTPVILADTVGATEVLMEPACFKFERSVNGLVQVLARVIDLFDSGGLNLPDPLKYINYSCAVDCHIEDLLKHISRTRELSIDKI